MQGRVQGVGFRYFVSERARELRLVGICRNLTNGDVEVIAEGARGPLEAMLASISHGPLMASVDNITAIWLPATGEFMSFRIASTK